jgi:hypothetical protein
MMCEQNPQRDDEGIIIRADIAVRVDEGQDHIEHGEIAGWSFFSLFVFVFDNIPYRIVAGFPGHQLTEIGPIFAVLFQELVDLGKRGFPFLRILRPWRATDAAVRRVWFCPCSCFLLVVQ